MILELRNIFKTYLQGKLEVPVLKNVSLSVEEGEYVAIMGPSGSGKTTLMNLIGCLDSPTSGEYLLEGEDLSQQSDARLSDVRLHSIGFVFQSFYLLSRQTAEENVALPLLYAGVRRKERLETARQALERVGLGDRTGFKPTQLSGGQCQRVAIARAIVNNPKILLADEPTGALDTKSGEQIMEIFQKLNDEGVTIVMITHEQAIADHAQRILHIRDGRLVDADGNFLSPEEVPPEEETGPVGAEGDSLPEDVIPTDEFLQASPAAQEQPAEGGLTQEQSLDEALVAGLEAAAQEASGEEPEVPSPLPEEETAPPTAEGSPAAEESQGAEPEAPSPAPEEETTPPPAEGPLTAKESQETEASSILDQEIAALLNQAEQAAKRESEQEVEASPRQEPEEAPQLVARPSSKGGPEQLSFDIWAVPEEAAEPAQPEEPQKANDAVPPQEDAAPLEGQVAWEEENPEAETAFGNFDAPLKLDVDLSQILAMDDREPGSNGGFGKPIKTQLDGLGLDGGDSSAHKEDDQ